jgi:hypothetical protein
MRDLGCALKAHDGVIVVPSRKARDAVGWTDSLATGAADEVEG